MQHSTWLPKYILNQLKSITTSIVLVMSIMLNTARTSRSRYNTMMNRKLCCVEQRIPVVALNYWTAPRLWPLKKQFITFFDSSSLRAAQIIMEHANYSNGILLSRFPLLGRYVYYVKCLTFDNINKSFEIVFV